MTTILEERPITSKTTYELGTCKGQLVFLHSNVTPGWDDPEKFVVEIFYKEVEIPSFNEVKHTVARIDNKSHGGEPHMDQEFKTDSPKKFNDWNVYSAWKHMEENWRKYVRRYFRNHKK